MTARTVTRAIRNVYCQCHFIGYLLKYNTCINVLKHFRAVANYSLFIFSLFTSIGYYGSAILIGLVNGHLWPAFQNMMICMAHHNERGTANSTILISWDVGMGLGILLGGILAENFGYSTAFWTVSFVNLTGVLLYIIRSKRFFLERQIEQ